MASYNKVILIGNLTRDPELTYLPNSQMPVCEIGLAINHKWRNRDGQQQEKVCFVDCRAFSKRAETLNQYMKKGQPIMVEGRLEFDRWEAQDGSQRSKHRITIENFQFLGGAKDSDGGYSNSAPAPAQTSSQPPQQSTQPSPPVDSPPMPSEDEIPF